MLFLQGTMITAFARSVIYLDQNTMWQLNEQSTNEQMNKEVKKNSFSPKIYTSLDRHWNRGSRNHSTSKNHSNYRVEKMLSKMPSFLPNVKSLIPRKVVMGSLGKKRISIFNISKLDFPPFFFPRSVLRKVWTAFDYIEKNQPEANTQCGKPFLIPPKVCRVIRNGKQNILMKSIDLDQY